MQPWSTERRGRGTLIRTEYGEHFVPDSAIRWRPEPSAAYIRVRAVLLCTVLSLIVFGVLTVAEARADPVRQDVSAWRLWPLCPFSWPMIWTVNEDAGGEA